MLKLFRRHTANCHHQNKGRGFKKCGCPLWAEGTLEGQRIRKSLDTANWEIASEKLLRMETGDQQKDCSVADAVDGFIAECESRNLSKTTVIKYRQTLNRLSAFTTSKDLTTVRAVADLETLKRFVASLTDSPRTVGKRIEALRTFIRYCEDFGWVNSNPASKIKKPLVKEAAVIPFTTDEYQRILNAIPLYPTRNSFKYDNHARLRAFIYVLRYTALRISDVVKLKKSAINEGRVLLRTQKTGATVHLPLPEFVVEALNAIANGSNYYFWSGNGVLKAAVGGWQRSLLRLFKLAKVKGHPHQFRHMMAVELLEQGVNVEHVAAILGNTPVIVYKHYAPWVLSRQKALDAAVMTVWNNHEAVP